MVHYYNSWFFRLGFLVKKYTKYLFKKNHLVNLDKSFCTCLAQLGNQIGPCHLTSKVTNKMTNYLTSIYQTICLG
jgi:hypothetical protein